MGQLRVENSLPTKRSGEEGKEDDRGLCSWSPVGDGGRKKKRGK